MPVTDITRDPEALTIVITAEFAAPIERVWQVYADPRQMERIWGPPEYPATIEEHSLAPGGRIHYFMEGPEGDRHYGWQSIVAVNEPVEFVFDDGFSSDDSYEPDPDLPVTRNIYRFEETDGGTRATYTTQVESEAAMEQLLEMGAEEGSREAINQIDALLAEG